MKKQSLAVIILSLSLLPVTAIANDTTATLGAGGLEFTKNMYIQMQSENLSISPRKINIDYVFKNTSPKPITTTVAFPLPPIPVSEFAQPMDLPVAEINGVLPPNYVNFKVSSNGTDIPVEEKKVALLPDQDVTQILKDYGLKIELSTYQNLNFKTYQAMSKDALERLQQLGLISYDWEQLHADGASETYSGVSELWSVQTVYYWRQVFPANQELAIHHEYVPLFGSSVPFSADTLVRGDMRYKKEFCMDPATLRGIKKNFGSADISPAIIDYILTTGANWQGPIQHFTLTLDKESPDNILSTCVPGLQKISPTQFQLVKTNFTPKKDLHILVVSKNHWYR